MKFNSNDSQIILLAKGHYKEDLTAGLGILYKDFYAYDTVDTRGVYGMVCKVCYDLFKERGSLVEDIEWINEHSLPTRNVLVGGKDFGFFAKSAECRFDDTEMRWARIYSMMAYIRHTSMEHIILSEITEPLLTKINEN